MASYSYFSMIPFFIDDLHLSPGAFRLYCHIKRVAGEAGQCWQTQATLQSACNMSNRTIIRAKRELIKAHLIRLEYKPINHHIAHLITLVNVWDLNHKKYSSGVL